MNNDEKGRTINNIGDNTSSIWTKYGIDHEASSNTPAEIYEQRLVPTMFEPFAKNLIQLCNIQPSDRILELLLLLHSPTQIVCLQTPLCCLCLPTENNQTDLHNTMHANLF
jgi:hypothetical protein